jgi:hypothetical protein
MGRECAALATIRAMSADAPPDAHLDTFVAAARTATAAGTLVRIVLSTRRAGPATLRDVRMRPVDLAGQRRIAVVERHATREVTRHLDAEAALAEVRASLQRGGGDVRFGQATLLEADGRRLQLQVNRAGDRARLVRDVDPGTAAADAVPSTAHDRQRPRRLPLDAPFLAPLGLVDAEGRVVPKMARKWRQVDKFLEIVDAALDDARIAPGTHVAVADFGSGKGYLTFAVHAHLAARLGVAPTVTGHELRADLVDFCNRVASETGASGLSFVQGDLARAAPARLDLLIALHACDTATDEALALGVRSGAQILISAPCCHRELRPVLALPEALRPLLRHGIHLGREAEMVTDALRALALERAGYDAKVFEFVSLEHTAQNKMITAVRRPDGDPRPAARAVEEAQRLRAFYGVVDQALERLLAPPSEALSPGR